MDKFEIKKRNAIMTRTKNFCVLAEEHDFVEVTEWSNGEGVDVNMYSKNADQMFHLTWGQFDALKKLIKKIDKLDENVN